MRTRPTTRQLGEQESLADYFVRTAPCQARALKELGHFDGRPEAYEAALKRAAELRAADTANREHNAQVPPGKHVAGQDVGEP